MRSPCPAAILLASLVALPLAAQMPVCGYTVIHAFPHDPTAFTQGLVWADGTMYESTGLWGQSTVRRVDLTTGQVEQVVALSNDYFGEGLAAWGDELIQLTYTSGIALRWDRTTFEPTGQHTYATQGWGLDHDGHRLVMSDGSATLYFRDPETFAEAGRVSVTENGSPLSRLNELEHVGAHVWANVWLTDRIVRIDPVTGRVTSVLDLTGLRPAGADVLNGIAWDPVGERLFVTGKNWPTLYEIEVTGCTDPLVFSDGFEWGTAERWSADSSPG